MKKTNELVAAIAVLLLLAFSYSADYAVSGFFMGFRLTILDIALGIATNFGILVLVMFAMPFLLLYKKDRKHSYMLLAALILSSALALAAKILFLRHRPMDVISYPLAAINYSFPSLHSMAAFSSLPILLRKLPKYGNFWIAFAAAVAFSRVYFNLHYLSDVVFGAAAGYLMGFLLRLANGENKQV